MKREIIIAVLLLSVLLLTGCGSRSSDAATPTATPTTEASATPEVTASPTATPAATPTAAPTEAPTPAPTATPSPAPTATPTPAPTATPSPAPEKPFVKKHPENVTVSEGGSCFFEADYINAIWAVWHFVSPDGTVDLTYENTGSRFPNMQVKNGMYSKMELSNIPLEANGWKVYCRYTNAGGYTDTNTATLTVTSAAPGDFPVVGSYMDSVSQRASMEITGVPGAYSARIHWGSSAWESTEWEFSGSFGTDGVMHFNNAAKYNVVYDASGRETRTALYTNGAGTLTYSPATDSFSWNDGQGTTGNFVRSVPTPTAAPVANQWTETTDLDAAVRNAGVEFHPPITEALPAGVSLDIYRSMAGIIEARYSGGTMLIRKSNIVSGSDLSGDMNTYSLTWEHGFKNVGSVRCRGNGDTVNEATFSAGGYYYSISYLPGREGLGLTLDQINSIIQGMN